MHSDSTAILIVENDSTLNNTLAYELREKGFIVEQCNDGEQGLLSALTHSFDLILLAAMLPTMTGFSVLNRLRKSQQTPVMMLMDRRDEADRIQSYSCGADDVITKSLTVSEVLVRINSVLRRSYGVLCQPNQVNQLKVDSLSLDRTQQQLRYSNQDINLTPIQFKLLWALVEHRNEVLNKPYLYQLVLEREFNRYDRSLDMHLSRVRRKLVNVGMPSDRLSTVHGKGYRFK